MGIKTYNPYTPSRRNMTGSDFSEITKSTPEKSLLASKKKNAGRIFVATTFGLFTNGLEKFDKAFEEGKIYRILTTNLVYQTPELLEKPWYINCDMSKYIAYIIDTLNHDSSISDLLDPSDRIQRLLAEHNAKQA